MMEFHVDCYNFSSGGFSAVLHGLVDVFFGTIVNGSVNLDKVCGVGE
jgi:hypothetical protein